MHSRRIPPTGVLGTVTLNPGFDARAGGLITSEAVDAGQAERFVAADPFMRGGLAERHWLTCWDVE